MVVLGMKSYPVIFRDNVINHDIRISSLNHQDSNGKHPEVRVFVVRGWSE